MAASYRRYSVLEIEAFALKQGGTAITFAPTYGTEDFYFYTKPKGVIRYADSGP